MLLELPYWQSVVQNAIGCAIGSIFAIAISILIYWLTIIQAERASKKAAELIEQNQLKAFAMMVKDAINFTERQVANTREFNEKLKPHPNTFPLLHMQPLGALTRIIDAITVEKTGMTYMKQFPGKDSAKEFIAILDAVDYLNTAYLTIKDQLERASDNNTDRAYKISDYFDISDKLLWDYFAEAPATDEVAKQIWSIKHEFLNNRKDGSDIHYVYDSYFLPLWEFTNKAINVPKPTPFIVNLHYNLGKGVEHYRYWNNGYDLFAGEMSEVQGDIDASLSKLKNWAAKILTVTV